MNYGLNSALTRVSINPFSLVELNLFYSIRNIYLQFIHLERTFLILPQGSVHISQLAVTAKH